MSDVLLTQGLDGGEITVTNGVVELDDSPFTAIYISLFGGNLDDSGDTDGDPLQYWGNYSETDPVRQLRSKTQYLLIGLPAIPANLIRIEEAVASDLEWLKSDIADSIAISATLPARSTVRISVGILGRSGQEFHFEFRRPWSAG